MVVSRLTVAMLTVIGGDGDDHLDGSRLADSVALALEGGEGDDIFENLTFAGARTGARPTRAMYPRK